MHLTDGGVRDETGAAVTDDDQILDLGDEDDVLAAVVCGGPAFQETWDAALEVARFHVAARPSRGIEAIELAAMLRPALLVLDLAVAGQLGVRVITAIHVAAPQLPVVVVTPFPGLAGAARSAGAYGVLLEDARPEERLAVCLKIADRVRAFDVQAGVVPSSDAIARVRSNPPSR